jgi:hypothetical protein
VIRKEGDDIMTFIQKLSVGLAVSLCLIATASAADTSGKILGSVKDPAGKFIPHATVTRAGEAITYLDLLLISRHLERILRHAVSIADQAARAAPLEQERLA